MDAQLGLLFAFIALLGWGFGDFFIQKTTRIMGVYKTLFCICAGAAIVLFPFVYDELHNYSSREYQALAILSGIIFIYALALFEAFRRGKLSVVEAVVAFELPLTVCLGVFIGGEALSLKQFILIVIIFIGIALAASARLDHLHIHKRIFEKGVLLALAGAFLSALTNFYIGTYSQSMSPLFVIWATHSMLAILCAVYILLRDDFGSLWRIIKAHPGPVIAQSVLDNAAWIGYAFATSMIPISLTVAISESYIALAALLGYFIGRERLGTHQIVGALIAIGGAITLAVVI
ncbi:MAG: EamA family transporter [Minisyncoccia bacterium]